MQGTGPDAAKMWEMSEAKKDLLTGIALLLLAIGGFVFINPNGASVYAGDGGLTWRSMPFAYASALVLTSSIYIFQSLRKMRAPGGAKAEPKDELQRRTARTVLVRRVVTLVLLLVFAALLQVIGFAILAPLFLFALFRLYERGRWQGDATLALVGGFCLWLLFVPVLKLNLAGAVFDPLTPLLMRLVAAVGL